MSLFTAVSVAVLVFSLTGGRPRRWRAGVSIGAGLAMVHLGVAMALGAGWFVLRRRNSMRRRRLEQVHAEGEQELLTHSMLIALSGGLSPSGALVLAREGLTSSLGGEVDQVLRLGVEGGLTASLLNASGVGGRLFRQIGASNLTGSPLELTLTALATEYRDAARARAVEQARRLPVKMVLPLTLLMLPGLLILMASPIVLPPLVRVFESFSF